MILKGYYLVTFKWEAKLLFRVEFDGQFAGNDIYNL